MENPFLGTLVCGAKVYDRADSHLHEGVLSLLEEAFKKINSRSENFLAEMIDFGRVIGTSACVPTTQEMQIVYAIRPPRTGHTRFVKNVEPLPCSTLVIVLKKRYTSQGGGYVLITSFIGGLGPVEPFDKQCKDGAILAESLNFWNTHALCWESAESRGTSNITTEYPW